MEATQLGAGSILELSEPVTSQITGIHLTLTEDVREWYDKARAASPEAECHEVVIRHGDKVIEMTFEEFLEKVGL